MLMGLTPSSAELKVRSHAIARGELKPAHKGVGAAQKIARVCQKTVTAHTMVQYFFDYMGAWGHISYLE